jgi:polyphosphate kinase
LFAKVDTGAEHSLFDRGFAEALRIDVERGMPRQFSTVTGEFRAYGHEVSVVSGWLNRVRLAQVDYDSLVHLSPYDE